jgi:isopentenyl diphosphate isomerase/L-lactate dehydrogenase-like FMN-dependent dehydrogenase
VAEVLPYIAKAVGGKVAVTAGGGVRTGFDVMKMLALGADAALVGRDVARAAIGGGASGVAMHFEYLRGDFRRAMMLTGCNSVEDIDGRVLDREP